MKKLIKAVVVTAVLGLFSVGSVHAITDTIAISKLPDYLNTDNFNLSYSALSNSPNVQFCYRKDGESYQTFGSLLTTSSGQIQVTGSQISEQAKYFFKAVLNGAGCTGGVSDETSVIYDTSGPNPVSNYSKEQVSPSLIRLHWKNPSNSDFSRVFIYRSESINFSAGDSTKVGELGGAPDADRTWDNIVDAGKTYYYALRAVDRAGNPSGLVSDSETIIEATETIVGESEVVILPASEQSEGSVLGETEDEDTDTTKTDEGVDAGDVLGGNQEEGGTSLLGQVLKALALAFVVYGFYRFFRRKK